MNSVAGWCTVFDMGLKGLGVADAERVDDAEGWEANRSCWLE